MTSSNETESAVNQSGYIYILYNEMFSRYGEQVFKIGKTSNIATRLKTYRTCYIEPCIIKHLSSECRDMGLAEMLAFQRLSLHRISPRREFFDVELAHAQDVIDEVVDAINAGTLCEAELVEEQRQEYLARRQAITDEHTPAYLANNTTLTSEERQVLQNDLKYHLMVVLLMLKPSAVEDMKHLYTATTLYKLKLLSQFQQLYGIEAFDLAIRGNYNHPVVGMDSKLHQSIQRHYRTARQVPRTAYEVYQMYASMLRHLTSYNFVVSKQLKKAPNRDKTAYYINKRVADTHRLIFCKLHPSWAHYLRRAL